MNLYEQLFHLTDLGLFFVCICGVSAISLAAIGVMTLTRYIFPNTRGTAIVATMLSGILLPTGMVIAFVASDVWKNDERGRIAVEQEATAVSDSIRITKHLAVHAAAPIKERIRLYVQAAVNDEWPLMSEGRYSELTELALDDLMVAAVRMEVDADNFGEAIAGQELRKYVTRIEIARDTRLRIAETRIRAPKWLAVFILLFVSACVIAELHLNFRRALVISISLFSLGFGVTIFLISSYDRPFTGRASIQPLALKQVVMRAQ